MKFPWTDRLNSLNLSFVVGVICLSVFCVTVFQLYKAHEGYFYDCAHLSGDTPDYQTIAVNLGNGYGYAAGFAPGTTAADYKFAIYPHERKSKNVIEIMDLYNKGLEYDFTRCPGYPVFLCLVYKLFGIHPNIAQYLQVAMIGFAISLLPWFGWRYWGKIGILSGILASYLANNYLCFEPNRILSESLIDLVLAMWAVVFVIWDKRPTHFMTAIIGLVTGIILAVKGSNNLILVFFLALMFIRMRASKNFFTHAGIYMVTSVMLLLPWGLYTLKTSGHFYLSSSQFEEVLFYGNNELALSTGAFSAWEGEPGTTYYQLKDSSLSTIEKYFCFLSRNKDRIPELLAMKFDAAFKPPYNFIAMSMLAYYILYFIFRRGRAPIFPLIYFFAILATSLIFYGCTRFSTPFVLFMTLPATYMPFYLFMLFSKHKA